MDYAVISADAVCGRFDAFLGSTIPSILDLSVHVTCTVTQLVYVLSIYCVFYIRARRWFPWQHLALDGWRQQH